jgi:hypothetical protein
MNDDEPENAASGMIGGDEMFTVRRSERTASASTPPPESLTYREVLAYRIFAINAELSGLLWPPLLERIEVSAEDPNYWRSLPDGWAEALEAEGHPPEKEVRGRFEFGMNFILRRVKPLSREYWLVKEAIAIRRCLDAPDRDAELWAADALGALVQQAHLHQLHLPAVRRRAKQVRPFKAKAKENPANKMRHEAATTFHAELRRAASEIWKRSPSLTATSVAERIHSKLLGSGRKSSVSNIRRIIASEKPPRP